VRAGAERPNTRRTPTELVQAGTGKLGAGWQEIEDRLRSSMGGVKMGTTSW